MFVREASEGANAYFEGTWLQLQVVLHGAKDQTSTRGSVARSRCILIVPAARLPLSTRLRWRRNSTQRSEPQRSEARRLLNSARSRKPQIIVQHVRVSFRNRSQFLPVEHHRKRSSKIVLAPPSLQQDNAPSNAPLEHSRRAPHNNKHRNWNGVEKRSPQQRPTNVWSSLRLSLPSFPSNNVGSLSDRSSTRSAFPTTLRFRKYLHRAVPVEVGQSSPQPNEWQY